MTERGIFRVTSWQPADASPGESAVVAGYGLPSQVGATLARPIRALCIGPRDWFLITPEATLPEGIELELARQGLALTDLSFALRVLEVRGASAREILSKGCGLDFHPKSFGRGQCARTRFAQIPVVIDCLGDVFELYVGRSYSRYMESWLRDASS